MKAFPLAVFLFVSFAGVILAGEGGGYVLLGSLICAGAGWILAKSFPSLSLVQLLLIFAIPFVLAALARVFLPF